MNTRPLLLFYHNGNFTGSAEVSCQQTALASLHEMSVNKGHIKPDDSLAYIQMQSGAMLFPYLEVVFYPQGSLKRSKTKSLNNNQPREF